MFQRYVNIWKQLSMFSVSYLDDILMSKKPDQKIDDLLEELSRRANILASLVWMISKPHSCGGCFVMFVKKCHKWVFYFPECKHWWVCRISFELALVKIHQSLGTDLTYDEQKTIRSKTKMETGASMFGEVNSRLVKIALKLWNEADNRSLVYMNTHFIVPTSNMCLKLYSQACHTLTDYWKIVHPTTLKMQVLLFVYQTVCGTSDIKELILWSTSIAQKRNLEFI